MTARQMPLTCSGHTRPVVDLKFSPVTPDGVFIISACKDGKPILRNGVTGDWVGTFEGHKGAVWGATINDTALLCATGAADFSARVWDAVTGDVKHSYDHPHIVKAVDFSKDSTKLLTGCNDKNIRCWDVETPDKEVVKLSGHTGAPKKAIFGVNENEVISGGDDKTMRVWDIRSGKEVKAIALDASLTSMERSADDKVLTTTHGNTVSFWDATSLEKLNAKKMDAPAYTASLHPDKKTFVWGGLDNMLHVVDYATCEQVEEYKGHFGPVHCVQYSPDGEVYASGSEDGTVRLWQTRVGTEYGLWKFTSGKSTTDSKSAEKAEGAGTPNA